MKLALPFAILAAVLLLACQTHAAPARRAQPRQNKPEIPEVARKEAICFAYYTVRIGEPPDRVKALTHQQAAKP